MAKDGDVGSSLVRVMTISGVVGLGIGFVLGYQTHKLQVR
jgi:hypothetical protein